MTRTYFLLGVFGSLLLAALWSPSLSGPEERSVETARLHRGSAHGETSRVPAGRRSLSEREARRHLRALYRLQSRLASAQAEENARRVEGLLRRAVEKLRGLSRRANLTERPRFRALFRGLTAAYEARYGVPDTLSLPSHKAESPLNRRFLPYGSAGTSTGSEPAGKRPPRRSANASSLVSPTSGNARPSGKRRSSRGAYSPESRRSSSGETAGDKTRGWARKDLRPRRPEVPLPLRPAVKESIAFLLQHREQYLRPWLRRAQAYFPMIEQVLAAEGLPSELKYLALVESGLSPTAKSHAGAAGMWQFMPEAARRSGLSIGPWVDERLDPEKSTRAAARHLKGLYRQFGRWHLALAGYNYDPTRVRAIVREQTRSGKPPPSYWEIREALPPETRRYVPLYVAAALIFSNPERFGLGSARGAPQYAFDYVPVRAPLRLGQVARLAGASEAEIRALNPELRAGRLPPAEWPYYVRLPVGTYPAFKAGLRALPEEKLPKDPKLRAGVQTGRLATHYQVDRSALLAANGASLPAQMHVGERLEIPARSYAGNARLHQATGGSPVRIRYGSRAVRTLGSGGPQEGLASLSAKAPAP